MNKYLHAILKGIWIITKYTGLAIHKTLKFLGHRMALRRQRLEYEEHIRRYAEIREEGRMRAHRKKFWRGY